jgi:hypothetical protein
MSTSVSRCDQILALIDACLADLDPPVRGQFGAQDQPTNRSSRRSGPQAQL